MSINVTVYSKDGTVVNVECLYLDLDGEFLKIYEGTGWAPVRGNPRLKMPRLSKYRLERLEAVTVTTSATNVETLRTLASLRFAPAQLGD